MPANFSIRTLGVSLVLLLVIALFLPWNGASLWVAAGCGWTLAGLTILYVAMVVQSAPPYDDRAFHRTLPPGDGVAFWKILRMQLLLLAGFAGCVAVYCVVNHFTWRSFELGLVPLVGVFGLLSALGIAATLATSRGMSKRWAWLLVFGVPGLSLYLRQKYFTFGISLDMESPWQVALLFISAAGMYPVIWWLIAARRQWRVGAVLMLATGLLMPWLWGDYLSGAWQWVVPVKTHLGMPSKAELVRKAVPEVAKDQELLVQDFLDVKGLGKDELLMCSGFLGPKNTKRPLGAYQVGFFSPVEVVGSTAYSITGTTSGELKAALADDGTARWGREAVLEILRHQLPPGMTLMDWDESKNGAARLQVFPVAERGRIDWSGTIEDLKSEPWTVESRVMSFSRSKAFDLATGGSAWMPGGGRVTVRPLIQDSTGTTVALDYTTDGSMNPEGRPGLSRRATFNSAMYVVIADEQGNEAFVLPAGGEGGDVFLGRRLEFRFPMAKVPFYAGSRAKPSSELLRRVALLPRCKVYLFCTYLRGGWKEQELEPPVK